MDLKLISLIFSTIFFAFANASPPLQIEPFASILHEEESSIVKNDVTSTPGTRLRLPVDVVPFHYELFVRAILDEIPEEPELKIHTAPSNVKIHVTCLQNTRNITLHSNLINITESTIKVTKFETNEELEISNTTIDHGNDRHFFHIEMAEPLESGQNYSIYIEYTAPISRDVYTGFYLGTYFDPITRTQKQVASTQMECCYARQLLPCFDEPIFKAEFSVQIARLEKYTALANGDILTTVPYDGKPGWEIDTFEKIPRMSTYLLAILVSEFDYAEANRTIFRGKQVRTYGAQHLIDRQGGNYSADQAARILSFFEQEYLEEYPLTKMDSVALPNFTFGAMENWGLNKYRISLLINIPGETTEHNRYRMDLILGHELAHQWFGNLVSCGFWSDIWLNEGFATYTEYLAVQAISPEFNPEHKRHTEAFQFAMQFDVTPASHAIIHNGQTPVEIMSFFDRVTYEKGGSLIKMMEGFLGYENLKKGLQNYLTKMKYQGAFTDDLWDSLTDVAHETGVLDPTITMKDIMDPWTMQKGFPLVRVSIASDNRVFLSQEKFSLNGRLRRKRSIGENELWYIPLSIATGNEPNFGNHTPKLWIERGVSTKVFGIDTNQWIILNPDSTGYFRVMYDATLLGRILQQLTSDPSIISPISRSQLLDDYFNLAFNSYTQIENALDLSAAILPHEDLQVVWETFFTNMRKSFNQFSAIDTFDEFRRFLIPHLESVLEKLGHEQLPAHFGENVVLRSHIYDWACAMQSPSCLDYTNKLFDLWEANPLQNPIPIDLQNILYCSGVSIRPHETFQFIWDKYQSQAQELDGTQRGLFLNALACSKDSALLRYVLDLSLDETGGLLKSDSVTLMQRVAANSNGRTLTFNFIRERYEDIILYLNSTGPVTSVLSTLSTYLNTDSELNDFQNWIAGLEGLNIYPEIIQASQGILRTIDSNVKWMNDFHNDMKNWFISKNS